MARTLEGNLIELATANQFDAIIHGCNCLCQMGKGIALTIKNTWPEAYEADLRTIKGNRNKLGSYSSAWTGSFYIINAYTQYAYNDPTGQQLADLNAIRMAMRAIKQDFSGLKLAYPLIGAGLAGGDWREIYPIILQELQGEDHTLISFPS